MVTAEVIAAHVTTLCHCQEQEHMAKLGLPTLGAGMPVDSLIELGGGCTQGRWICPTLDNVRRRYGK